MKVIRTNKNIVAEIWQPDFVANNTDWLQNGLPDFPDAVYALDDEADVEIDDYYTDGVVDTLGRYKEPKKREIAAARWAAETGGVTIAGMTIDTSRESQALITGAALQATVDPTYTCHWKTASGFVALDAATILAVATAVRAHVQACFDREAGLLELIEAAETAEEVQGISW